MKEPRDKRTKAYKEWLSLQPKGVGDVVKKFTDATGITKAVEWLADGRDCGCNKREKWLNHKLPFRYKPRCFVKSEYDDWKEFREVRTIRITNEQIKFICRLFADVFNRGYYEPCRTCSAKPLIAMIDKLDTVYDSYKIN